jgi:hypothetical protein
MEEAENIAFESRDRWRKAKKMGREDPQTEAKEKIAGENIELMS